MRQGTLIVLVLLSFLNCPIAQSFQSTQSHDSINIFLANRNGAVLLTDSRLSKRSPSGEWERVSDDEKKLYKLDDRTVVSIADFYSNQGCSFADHRSRCRKRQSTSVESLTNGFTHGKDWSMSVHEKSIALYKLLRSFLGPITEKKLKNCMWPVARPELQFIVVGYGSDGGLVAIKRVVSAVSGNRGDRSHRRVKPHVDLEEIKTVGDEFVFVTAGLTQFADERLRNPEHFPSEPGLAVYRAAKISNARSGMSLDEMRSLAQYLKQRSEEELNRRLGYSLTGGGLQSAILVGGHVYLEPTKAFKNK